MKREAFKKFCDEWRIKGAVDFTRKSHFEEMSDMLEPHAEAVEVRKDEFHALAKNVYYPRKETSDKLGKAAGISFSGDVRVAKQSDGAWVGTAYPQELGPDGKMITWAPASYEFNPADRAKEELLRDQVKYKQSAPSELAIELKTLEYKKVALRRADTGARVAAIISAIGMPTGFKDLFMDTEKPNAVRYFLFSRIIVNAKNEFVMSRALDAMFGAARAIAGPLPNTPQIAAPITNLDDPPMVPAEKLAAEALEDEGFGGRVDEEKRDKDHLRTELLELEQWIASGKLGKAKEAQAQEVIDNEGPIETVEYYNRECRKLFGEEAAS